MNKLSPIHLIAPVMALSGMLILSLSVFSGNAYSRKISQIETHEQTLTGLSAAYPDKVQQWRAQIEASAHQHQLDANLIAAVMLQESGGQVRAISSSGAVGLMQVMPNDGLAAAFMCARGPCFTRRPSTQELLEPSYNVEYGSRMLANLIINHGSLREALYRYGPMDVGYHYADIVLSIYERYR